MACHLPLVSLVLHNREVTPTSLNSTELRNNQPTTTTSTKPYIDCRSAAAVIDGASFPVWVVLNGGRRGYRYQHMGGRVNGAVRRVKKRAAAAAAAHSTTSYESPLLSLNYVCCFHESLIPSSIVRGAHLYDYYIDVTM